MLESLGPVVGSKSILVFMGWILRENETLLNGMGKQQEYEDRLRGRCLVLFTRERQSERWGIKLSDSLLTRKPVFIYK